MVVVSFFMGLVLASLGQTRKIYVDETGKYLDNSKKASGYILVTKLDGDSAYRVKRFDMADTIVFAGTFKDEALSIPNGRFVYYGRRPLPKGKDATFKIAVNAAMGISVDTNNYVKEFGYYLNGKKEGLWVNYVARGVKASEIMYQNGKQNGQYKIYDTGSKGWTEGTMVNDLLEGKLYNYNADSVLISELDIKNGRMVNKVDHFQNSKENPDLDKYLESKLAKYHDLIIRNLVSVKFTVDKTGKIVNPQILKGINPEVNNALIAALSSAPTYTSATYDGAPVSQTVDKALAIFDFFNNKNIAIRAAEKNLQQMESNSIV